jgi:hypothetical protein
LTALTIQSELFWNSDIVVPVMIPKTALNAEVFCLRAVPIMETILPKFLA